MSITDELREWVAGASPAAADGCSISVGAMTYGCKKALLAIADRIDAEHEKATSELNMAEHGWVRLPKDADGEPIHVGDWVTPNGMDTGFKVRQMHFSGEWSLDLEGFGISQTCPDMCRHYHKPTVEDVLQELVTKVWNRGRLGMPVAESNVRKLVSEYDAKLRELGVEVDG